MHTRKKQTLYRILIIFLLAAVTISFISNDLLDRLISGLANHKKTDFQEKIYLHFDNPYYVAGEDIFFKAYLTDAYHNIPGGVSDAINIGIYDENNKQVSTRKYAVKNGFVSGVISLADTLRSGNYTILSYSNWMRNFDEDYFFSRKIQIYGAKKRKVQKEENQRIDFQFFPEGGHMVNTLEGKIAFKATNNYGRGIKVSGELFDDFGNKLADIHSNSLGMGAFMLKPNKEGSYFIHLNGPNADKKHKLPVSQNEGLAMSVNNLNSEYIEVSIQKVSPSDKNVLIVLQSNGEIHYYAKTLITANGTSIKIPKNNLKSGISQLTVFDINTQLPLTERLVFIDGMRPLNIKVTTNKEQYLTREKVTIKIRVNNYNKQPIQANFSMSVSNRNEKSNTDNIYSYLLLSSELKGNIENPNYYFQNNDSTTKLDLDYLLLTQGWRRFVWNDILNPNLDKHHYSAESEMFNIHTNIFSEGEPLISKEVSILLLKQLKAYQSKSNENGELDFSIENYVGEEIFIYQQKSNRNKIIEIDNTYHNLLRPIVSVKDTYYKEPRKINNGLKNQLINLTYHNKRQTDNSKISTQYMDNNYAQFYDKSIILSDYLTFLNIPEFFKEVVANVLIRKNKEGSRELRIYSKELKIKYKNTPLYLINGKPTFDTNFILNLDISTVESIGIIHSIKNLSLFGDIGKYGVLAINTSEEINKVYENNIVSASGYDIIKEFYQPKYDDIDIKSNTVPDFRSVLYWNPNVITDENGEALIEFYTSDELSKYSITLEGISSTGQIGTLEQKLCEVAFSRR